MRSRLAVYALLSSAPLLCASGALAGHGLDLDVDFGIDGSVELPDERPHVLALQPDGKIVLAVGRVTGPGPEEDFAVLRYLSEGTPDPAFGTGGVVVTDVGASVDRPGSILVQADGKIVVVGATSIDFDIVAIRYESDGDLDPTFDGDGIRVIPNQHVALPYGLLQPDGNLLIGRGAVLYRLLEDGSPDAAFGSGGAVATAVDRLALQSDGAILAVGRVGDPDVLNGLDLLVSRFSTDGMPDPSFGSGGSALFDVDEWDLAGGMVVLPDDRIVLAGRASGVFFDPLGSVLLLGLDADGGLDPSFGAGGVVLSEVRATRTVHAGGGASGLARQADGRLIVGLAGADRLGRYLPDGRFDPTFDGDGRLADPSSRVFVQDLALQPNEMLVVTYTEVDPSGQQDRQFLARHVFSPACAEQPAAGCTEGWGKGRVLADERSAGNEKLLVKLLAGPEIAATSFGDPTVPGGTEYAVCLYDDADRLVGEVELDRAGEDCDGKACWRSLGPRGYRYKDALSSADGTSSLALTAGQEGRSSISLKGKNRKRPELFDLSIGIADRLQSAPSLTIQLVRSDSPECFAHVLMDIRRQEPKLFEAR